MSVIVAGWFDVDPEQRDAFVAQRIDGMKVSRAEQGCIEYVIAADPVEPGRAILYERWETQADLDAHGARLAAETPPADAVAPSALSIVVYDVGGERTLA